MNPADVSQALLAASDSYLRDASAENLSDRGRWDALFESGYLAVLSVLTPIERAAEEHPNEIAMQLGSERLGLDAEQGLRFLHMRCCGQEAYEFENLSIWVEAARSAAR